MRAPASVLLSLLALFLLTACGGDDVADDPKLSDQGKEIVKVVGGPFTADEFDKFLADLPEIPGLTAERMQDVGDGSDADLTQAAIDAVKARGWDEQRFMYIYSHTMTMMNLDQMQRVAEQMQDQFKDMPEDQRKAMEQMMGQQLGSQMEAVRNEVDKQVPSSEQALVRDNMVRLHTALGLD